LNIGGASMIIIGLPTSKVCLIFIPPNFVSTASLYASTLLTSGTELNNIWICLKTYISKFVLPSIFSAKVNVLCIEIIRLEKLLAWFVAFKMAWLMQLTNDQNNKLGKIQLI
jgi:hypothetical protein